MPIITQLSPNYHPIITHCYPPIITQESILDLAPYLEKRMRVKFNGGREASGILKGYDPLLNIVLDGAIEYLRGVYSCILV